MQSANGSFTIRARALVANTVTCHALVEPGRFRGSPGASYWCIEGALGAAGRVLSRRGAVDIPARPGYFADVAIVQESASTFSYTTGVYTTTLGVELTVVDAPVRIELTVSHSGAMILADTYRLVRGDTIPVFRNGDGPSLQYAGTAAWVGSLQLFAFALLFTVLSLLAYRSSRR